ncbi:MAG: NDP-sugar synthase [Candidatus Sericytochromatia bacterium]|nr:NDP-sugar synthase [Candidatus Sericytochromatia bacterium]
MVPRAMIMSAGVGSRLEPLTSALPKPMAPIGTVPTLGHILAMLHQHGIREVAANLHYRADVVREYFGDGSAFGLEIRTHEEPTLMGTAGGVKHFESFLDRTFVVISGDACSDANLTALVAFHRAKGALATIAMTEEADTSKFGVVVTDAEGRIEAFQEKPKPEDALSHWVNTGIYVFEPEIFALIPADTVYDFGSQLFPALAEAGGAFYGFQLQDSWCDIGSLEQYRLAHYDALEEKVKLAMPGTRTSWGWLGKGAIVDPTAEITGPTIIGAGARVEAGARLTGRNTIGDNGVIGAGAQIHDAVLWQDVRIGTGAQLDSCILANGCTVGADARIEIGAVISRDCHLESKAHIGPGVRVWPGHHIKGVSVLADLKA